jgi:hypothetical protein
VIYHPNVGLAKLSNPNQEIQGGNPGIWWGYNDMHHDGQ